MSLTKAHNSELPPTPPPPLLIAVTLTTVVICFVCFSIVYICRCCVMTIINARVIQRSTSRTVIGLSPNASPFRGLDASLLQTFPTFLYDTIKEKKNKYSPECAICLLEFEENTMLRRLTICFHVFHRECIDLWLRSHTTCPVCRTDLDLPIVQTRKPHEMDEDDEEVTMDHVCVDVKEGDGAEPPDAKKLLRSHSTGHSIVMIRERDNEDEYRLRLVQRGHNHSKSCSMTTLCSNCGYVQSVFASSSLSGIENI